MTSLCECGCGSIPKGKSSKYCQGHNPPLKGKDNPNWKPGTAGKRAWAKVKADPALLQDRANKRREWTNKKRKADPDWWEGQKARKRREFAAYRRHVINHYGGRCDCCGEETFEFLCIDHIYGGGNEHRRKMGSKVSGKQIYRWLSKNEFPDGFRVLCHNCNFSTGAYGYCPHQQKEEV